MTTTLALTGTSADRVGFGHVRELATIEARRYAMRVSIWIGWLGTLAAATLQHPGWPGGSYESGLPMSFGLMILGVFVAGARTGAHDATTDMPALAEEAVMDGDDRIAARLLGLVMPVGLALVTATGIALVARVEGGFWMGEGPRRSDSVQYTPLEILQPVLLVALVGALGVVTGRAFRRPLLAIVAGGFVWFLMFPTYWIWNSPPMHVAVPLQVMPLHVDLPDVSAMSDTPPGWYVEYPGQYNSQYARDLVHIPTVAFHDLYLVGLIMIVAAAAAREHRRAVRLSGLALVVAGIAAQLIVNPY